MFTVSDTLIVLSGTNPENGSCKWTMSKAWSWSSFRIRGRSHIENDIRAMDPLLGIGTGLPIGTKLSASTRWESEQGAMIFVECPQASNWYDSSCMWLFTPLGTAKSKAETKAILIGRSIQSALSHPCGFRPSGALGAASKSLLSSSASSKYQGLDAYTCVCFQSLETLEIVASHI